MTPEQLAKFIVESLQEDIELNRRGGFICNMYPPDLDWFMMDSQFDPLRLASKILERLGEKK